MGGDDGVEVLPTGLLRPGLSRGHGNEFIEIQFIGSDCFFFGVNRKIIGPKEKGGSGRRWEQDWWSGSSSYGFAEAWAI